MCISTIKPNPLAILRSVASLALAFFFLTGCEKSSAPPAPPVSAAPPVPAAPPIPPPPAVPAGDLAGFAPDAVLSVTFKEINAQGYPMVMLKNLTGRDIDDIRGGFRLSDKEGNILHATGLTIAVPGQLFLAAGAEAENSPYGLNGNEDLMKRLATSPDELVFSFVAKDVTFMEK
jgi:hypothetical protein